MKHLIGVDEAGRGPLAGPVAVGVVAITMDFDWELIPDVGDSKSLSAKKREAVFRRAADLKKTGLINFAVCQSSNSLIDSRGIVPAISACMRRALHQLKLDPDDCDVRLDGALNAPSIYRRQTTIIGGDNSEKVIGLASILAKVTRDRYMERLAAKTPYQAYNFAKHKGYGTREHRSLIQKYGISDIHRRSFCRNIQLEKPVVVS